MGALMTENENTPEQDPQPATEIAPQPGDPGRPWLTIAIVAVVSLVLGAGGVLLALRNGWMPALQHAAGHESGTPPQGASSSGAQDMPGMPGMSSAPPTRPAGASDKAIYISSARQQMIGVRTAPVTHEALDTTIRTMGVLAYDESRTTMVHTKVAGWIDREYVNSVGQPVRRGQALFTVYSPDLVATQNEYLLALRAQAQLGSSQIAETRSSAASLLAATRERLKLWDITDAQIAELERTREPRKNVAIYAPFDGVVLERETLHIMDDKQRIALVETRTQGNEPGVPAQLIRYQFSNHLDSACLELDHNAQIISYELSATIALLSILVFAGSLDFREIIASQASGWWIWRAPLVGFVAFVIYGIASVAECNRTPFDLVEGESELTAGFHTEYASIRFAMFFLAEFVNIFVVCAISATVFLGGWMPFHIGNAAAFNRLADLIPPWGWFYAKTMALVLVFMWVRWTFPRLRVDQMMRFEWKFLMPLAFITLAVASVLVTGGWYFFPG